MSQESPNRYVFYDIESTSVDVSNAQMVQIALIETDTDLNILKDKEGMPLTHMFYIKMRPDMLADAGAFLVNKVDPRLVGHSGKEPVSQGDVKSELEANRYIRDVMMRTDKTCIGGYNSNSFDDEIIRYNFYRNMISPYEHEHVNGNSRVDVFKAVKMTRIMSPKSLNWPIDAKGNYSMRLELLSKENGLEHAKAHDALSDVEATISLGKLIKDAKPQIWETTVRNNSTEHVQRMMSQAKPVTFSENYISKKQDGTALMMPLSSADANGKRVIAFDLNGDASLLVNADDDTLKTLLTVSKSRRRVAYKGYEFTTYKIPTHKAPVVSVMPKSHKDESDSVAVSRMAERLGYDVDTVQKNIEIIQENIELIRDRVVLLVSNEPNYPERSAYAGLYSRMTSSIEDFHRKSWSDALMDNKNELSSFDAFESVNMIEGSDKDKQQQLLLAIYAKWGQYSDEWSDLNSLTKADVNELMIYRDFVNDNIRGEGEGLSIDGYQKARDKAVAKMQKAGTYTDNDKYIVAALDGEMGYVVDRSQKLNRFITPALERFAEKGREESPDKYAFTQAIFEGMALTSKINAPILEQGELKFG
jgi:exodeoxyribonuclease-1